MTVKLANNNINENFAMHLINYEFKKCMYLLWLIFVHYITFIGISSSIELTLKTTNIKKKPK